MKVIGYARVSTREQGDSGAGLAAQKRRISQEAERRDWQVEWVSDVSSGKSLKRQGIQAALEILAAGDILVVAKLDRLSRSVADFAELLERARKEGWAVVALDMGVDTTTPAGELVANVMMSVAQWERRVIGQRTKDGLAEKRAQGVTLGRPPVVERGAVECILYWAADGLGPRAIARELTATGVAPPRGGATWHASTVSRILKGAA